MAAGKGLSTRTPQLPPPIPHASVEEGPAAEDDGGELSNLEINVFGDEEDDEGTEDRGEFEKTISNETVGWDIIGCL